MQLLAQLQMQGLTLGQSIALPRRLMALPNLALEPLYQLAHHREQLLAPHLISNTHL